MLHKARSLKALALVAWATASQGWAFEITVTSLSDRVKVFSGGEWNLNILAIACPRGIAVVDAPFSRSVAGQFRRAIEAEFPGKPIRFLINTHGCDCHVGGNQAYADGTIIGHALLRDELTRAARDSSHPKSIESMRRSRSSNIDYCEQKLAEPDLTPAERATWTQTADFFQAVLADLEQGHEIRPPDVTFSEAMTLDLEGITLELLGFNYSHSASSILLFVPELGLVVEHGIFNKEYLPTFSTDGEIPPDQVDLWLATLDRLLGGETRIECVMDVHDSTVCGKSPEDLAASRDYFRRLRDAIDELRRSGLELENVKRRLSLETGFSEYSSRQLAQEHHARNLEVMWDLLERQAQARP